MLLVAKIWATITSAALIGISAAAFGVRNHTACTEISDPEEKLTCFDEIVDSAKARSDIATSDSQGGASSSHDTPTPDSNDDTPFQAPAALPEPPESGGGSTATDDGLLEEMTVPSISESQNLYRGAQAKNEYHEAVPFDATIVSVRTNQSGRFSVTLDNGQIWRETSGSKARVPKEGRTVEIDKGKMGGYRMKIEGVPSVAWVRRVK